MAHLRILLHIRASGGGGAERVFAALANEFAARGHEVTLAVDLAIDADQLLPAVELVDLGPGHVRGVLRLARLIRRGHYDVLMSGVAVSNVKMTLAKVLSLQRVPGLDKVRPYPWKVKIIYRLPGFMKPKPQYPGYLMEFDATGRLLRFAADETEDVTAQVTSGTVLSAGDAKRTTEVVVGSLLVPSVRKVELRPVDSSLAAVAQ